MVAQSCTVRPIASLTTYIDDWFASIVKPEAFYDRIAETSPRCYCYNVDLQGRWFLESTLPKNIATSLKDTRFVDFVVKRLRPVSEKERVVLEDLGIPTNDYPYCSPCGKELNLVRPAALPIVFHSLTKGDLIYGGTLTQTFDPQALAVDGETGRLYHRLDRHPGLDYGLVRSSLAVAWSGAISVEEHVGDTDSGWRYADDDRRSISIPWLPENSRPGPSAMPGDVEE